MLLFTKTLIFIKKFNYLVIWKIIKQQKNIYIQILWYKYTILKNNKNNKNNVNLKYKNIIYNLNKYYLLISIKNLLIKVDKINVNIINKFTKKYLYKKLK